MTQRPPQQRKRLGQVFLNQPNTIRKIVNDLELTGDELLLEIGGGDGRVSDYLAPMCGSLIINEIDERFVEILHRKFDGLKSVSIIAGSILHPRTLEQIISHLDGRPLVVYGSIPYYITTPILRWIIANSSIISRASLLMQKEVAERAVATPGNKEYGYLSVFLQLQSFVYEGALVRRSCFKPMPKVDSRVLNLIPKTEDISMFDERFWKFISVLFGQRRKQLRNLVKQYIGRKPDERMEVRLAEHDISLQGRPEQYAPHKLKELYEIVRAS